MSQTSVKIVVFQKALFPASQMPAQPCSLNGECKTKRKWNQPNMRYFLLKGKINAFDVDHN